MKKYLSKVPVERLRNHFRILLDTTEDLGVRIDRFKEQIDVDLGNYLTTKKKISLGMISQFLASCYPEEYIYYRYTLIEKASKDWGLPFPSGETGTPGSLYMEYLDFIKPIQIALKSGGWANGRSN